MLPFEDWVASFHNFESLTLSVSAMVCIIGVSFLLDRVILIHRLFATALSSDTARHSQSILN